MSDSEAASKDAPSNAQDAATPPQPAADDQRTTQPGNVPNVSPAAPRPIETFRPVVQAVRGGNGRFESLKPAEPPKAQPSALLKPLAATTYDYSASEPIAPKGGIKGLDAIPKGWPDLPSNVSLSMEIAWVQSERLRVVKDGPGSSVKVDLSKARSPAPSMAALSWLETSIRSYAKFIEVASKTASQANDEAEFVRKERMAIAEIDALLAEMYDAEG